MEGSSIASSGNSPILRFDGQLFDGDVDSVRGEQFSLGNNEGRFYLPGRAAGAEPKVLPRFVTRECWPLNGLWYGFTQATGKAPNAADEGADAGDDDPGTLLNNDNESATAFHGVSPYAWVFEDRVWRIFKIMMEVGRGEAVSVSMNMFLRYHSRTLHVLEMFRWPAVLHYLVYQFDWSQVGPGAARVPQSLRELADQWGADPIGFQRDWVPLIRKWGEYLVMPELAETVKRFTQPMFSPHVMQRLYLPHAHSTVNVYSANAKQAALDLCFKDLDYIDEHLYKEAGKLRYYFAVPASSVGCLDQLGPVVDLNRLVGWYNSGFKKKSTFGNTGDPDHGDGLIVTLQSDSEVAREQSFFSPSLEPVADEFMSTTIHAVYEQTLDDDYEQMTLPEWGQAAVIADDWGPTVANTRITFGANEPVDTNINSLATNMILNNVLHCRYAYRDTDALNDHMRQDGLPHGDYLHAPFPFAIAKRLLYRDAERVWNTKGARAILANMASSGVREVRTSVMDVINSAIDR